MDLDRNDGRLGGTADPCPLVQARGMDRLLRATINTWHGLLAAARSEEAFRRSLLRSCSPFRSP
jgi:hypothetical protein